MGVTVLAGWVYEAGFTPAWKAFVLLALLINQVLDEVSGRV